MSARELFERHAGNPILTADDWPYPVNAVFNPAAAVVDGETVLLARVEDRRGISHLTVARSRERRRRLVDRPRAAARARRRDRERAVGLRGPARRLGRRARPLGDHLHRLRPGRPGRLPRDDRGLQRRSSATGSSGSRRTRTPRSSRTGSTVAGCSSTARRPQFGGAHGEILLSRSADLVSWSAPEAGAAAARRRLVGLAAHRHRPAAAPHRARLAARLPRRQGDGRRRRSTASASRCSTSTSRPASCAAFPPGCSRRSRRTSAPATSRTSSSPAAFSTTPPTTRSASTTAPPTARSASRPHGSRICSTRCSPCRACEPRVALDIPALRVQELTPESGVMFGTRTEDLEGSHDTSLDAQRARARCVGARRGRAGKRRGGAGRRRCRLEVGLRRLHLSEDRRPRRLRPGGVRRLPGGSRLHEGQVRRLHDQSDLHRRRDRSGDRDQRVQERGRPGRQDHRRHRLVRHRAPARPACRAEQRPLHRRRCGG